VHLHGGVVVNNAGPSLIIDGSNIDEVIVVFCASRQGRGSCRSGLRRGVCSNPTPPPQMRTFLSVTVLFFFPASGDFLHA
jgi:hypothetical protein